MSNLCIRGLASRYHLFEVRSADRVACCFSTTATLPSVAVLDRPRFDQISASDVGRVLSQLFSLDPPPYNMGNATDFGQSVIPKCIFMKYPYTEKEITNSIGMKLVLIQAGTFKMGSPPGEESSDYDELQHEVTIRKDYYLGVYTVTQAQYEKVMGKNPSYFHGRRVAKRHPPTDLVVREVDSSNHPVENVSWENAVEFCKQLSGLTEEKTAGRVYRLPTEAEWEYACRAGSMTAFSFGDNMSSLGDFAWYIANSKGQTHPVGVKKPNAWGLYDMHGNVFEHCADWYEAYPQGSVLEQYGYNSRGGSWQNCAAHCRSASRGGGISMSARNCLHGIRLALSPSSQLAEVAEPVIGN